MTDTGTKEQLRQQCLSIAKFLGQEDYGKNGEGEDYTAMDYLADALDIDYIISRGKYYKGARLLVAFGGPNIYIDTGNNRINGYWGEDSVEVPYFKDNLGLGDALEEQAIDLFNLER